ncbi:hypothetical protein KDL01_21905 [Actinospica durhamensis]|uniref:Uncharacterized protein n=1 Tax=Actinospica durhamensis TaxID=1508375 RepID=A0A941ER64_9ACTN|nr:hypothetical protein [Actinospica durhamensis]MBR7835945.1 hypothetical protein [Actinospica durhamensis]
MSYSLYLIRFRAGDAAAMDGALLDGVIASYIVKREPEYGFVRIRTGDGGEAEVYAAAEDESELIGVTVTHFDRGLVLDVIATLADRLGAVVVLQEGVVLLPESARLDDLPEDLRSGAEFVEFSGAAIQAAIERV